MSGPDITVIIPTHDRLDFLQRAVASCLDGHEGVEVEVVVVDDGSVDGTRDWLGALEDPRVRSFFQEHRGGQAARNRGMDAARGRFVKFLDDDDWLAPDALARELDEAARSGADLCAGDVLIWEAGRVVRTQPAPPGPDAFCDLAAGEASTHNLRFLFARRLLDGLRWDPGLPVRQEVDFVLRAALRSTSYRRVDGVSGYVRHHHGARVNTAGRDRGPGVHLDIVSRLAEESIGAGLPAERIEALRVGLWKLLHFNYVNDPVQARRAWALIERLDPGPFRPPRPGRLLGLLDGLLGPMRVEALTAPVRRLKQRLRPGP